MIFADLPGGVEAIAGGGVTGMLVLVTTAMLRRTKDTDQRKDEFAQMVLDTASEREAKAWTERDAARAESLEARAQLERLRRHLDQQRYSGPDSG